MNIRFTPKELAIIQYLAWQLAISPEEVIIQALKLYQLKKAEHLAIKTIFRLKRWKGKSSRQ